MLIQFMKYSRLFSLFFSLPCLLESPSGLAALPAHESVSSGQYPEQTIYLNNDINLIVKAQEFKRPRIEQVLKHMAIQPGMAVLDIGAGSGQATYMIAEKLKGRGSVFATEIDPQLVEQIAQEARRRNLRNVYPVLVQRNGVDDFYAEHRYDRILFYNVLPYIRNAVEYLRTMRGFLADDGRLVIVNEHRDWDIGFVREDFADWEGFIKALEREDAHSPFHRFVWKPAEDVARKQDRALHDKAVLFFLNRSLGDYRLLEYFTEGTSFKDEVSFTPIEADYAAWRLARLYLVGFSSVIRKEKNLGELPFIDAKRILFLNKMLVIQRFRPYFVWGGPHPYESNSPQKQWSDHMGSISSTLAEAGYRLQEEYAFPPFQYIWIYADAEKTPANHSQ